MVDLVRTDVSPASYRWSIVANYQLSHKNAVWFATNHAAFKIQFTDFDFDHQKRRLGPRLGTGLCARQRLKHGCVCQAGGSLPALPPWPSPKRHKAASDNQSSSLLIVGHAQTPHHATTRHATPRPDTTRHDMTRNILHYASWLTRRSTQHGPHTPAGLLTHLIAHTGLPAVD